MLPQPVSLLPVLSLPKARRPINESEVPPHNLEPMTIICPDCRALHWMAERLSNSSKRHPKFGKCCLSGKIRLLDLTAPSQPLRRLLESQDHDAREFRKHIRKYNAALDFTSLGATFDPSLFHGGVLMPCVLWGSFITGWEHYSHLRTPLPLMPSCTSMTQLRLGISGWPGILGWMPLP